MQPAARLQAAIEILDDIEMGIANIGVPADVAVANYTRARRYIGSKDRRAIIEFVYAVLRQRGRHAWRLAEVGLPLSGRNLFISHVSLNDESLGDLFDAESPHAPPALTGAELAAMQSMPADLDGAPLSATHETPVPFVEGLQDRFGLQFDEAMAALNATAPMDVRSNRLKPNVDLSDELRNLDNDIEKTKFSPIGFRSKPKLNLNGNSLLREGFVEVQDEAAQLACYLTDVEPGMSVLDLCAGAGGKTLLLSALMQNKGQIFAFDTSGSRLKNAKPRIDRAGCRNIQTKILPSDNAARQRLMSEFSDKMDRLVIDAPCSGTGTWRRNPDQRWRLNSSDVENLSMVQVSLIQEAAGLVKPGGRIVYMTCSMLRDENERVVEHFQEQNGEDWLLLDYKSIWQRVLPGEPPETASSNPFCLQLVPHLHQTDGFFVAILARSSS